jgi:hypothetical protein
MVAPETSKKRGHVFLNVICSPLPEKGKSSWCL